MENKPNNDYKKNQFLSQDDQIIHKETFDDSIEKQHVEHLENKYEEEDIDIQVVNELATVQDDTTLPCYTVRVFVTGIVSTRILTARLQNLKLTPKKKKRH